MHDNIRINIDKQTSQREKPFRLRVMKTGHTNYKAQYFRTKKEAELVKALLLKVLLMAESDT